MNNTSVFLNSRCLFLLLLRLLMLYELLIRTRFSVVFFSPSYHLVGIAIMIVIFIIRLFPPHVFIHHVVSCVTFYLLRGSFFPFLCSILSLTCVQCRHLFTFHAPVTMDNVDHVIQTMFMFIECCSTNRYLFMPRSLRKGLVKADSDGRDFRRTRAHPMAAATAYIILNTYSAGVFFEGP